MNIFGIDTLDWREVKIDWDAINENIIKAGTPMSRDGLIANDGSCYGILMGDVLRKRNKRAQLMVSGCVDFAAAEAHSGIAMSDEAKAALPDVWDHGGSGGVSSWNDLTDKPFDENGAIMPEALPEGYPYKEKGVQHITWDGNTEGLAVGKGAYYKVGECLSADQVLGQQVTFNGVGVEESRELNAEAFSVFDGGWKASADDITVVFSVTSPAEGFSEPGLYFLYFAEAGIYVKDLSYMGETIHPMAPELLPAGVGGGAFIVNVTMDDEENYVADKTYAEISEALANGQMPYCICGTGVFHLVHSHALASTYATEMPSHAFTCVSGSRLFGIKISDNDTISYNDFGTIQFVTN